MAFRAAVRTALAGPLGGSLASRFGAATVTAILADVAGGAHDDVALAELTDALARAGVPRGRHFVLLAGAGTPDDAGTARAVSLRATLGIPVLVHDARKAAFTAGTLSNGIALELDDELREAEAIVACASFGATGEDGVHGGPTLLLPGLAAARTRAAVAAQLAGGGVRGGDLRAARLALAHEAATLVPLDFALAWSEDDPPIVRAGIAAPLFTACLADGWLEPRNASRP